MKKLLEEGKEITDNRVTIRVTDSACISSGVLEIVEKTGKMITLEPMQAYERKVIHSFLQDNPKVETRSIGQEPRRRIVISKID